MKVIAISKSWLDRDWLGNKLVLLLNSIRVGHQKLWHHQVETFPALLALCAGNSPVTGEFPSQRPVTRSFDVFLDLRLNKRSSKHTRHRWFQTPSSSLWRHCNVESEARINYEQQSNIHEELRYLPEWHKLYEHRVNPQCKILLF